MTIDLRTDKPGGTWVRRFGDHENEGVHVSIGNTSAHVTLDDFGVTFAADRQDVPAAWESPIDTEKLRAEVVSTLGRRMSASILKELIREFRSQIKRAYLEGESDARSAMREALGL